MPTGRRTYYSRDLELLNVFEPGCAAVAPDGSWVAYLSRTKVAVRVFEPSSTRDGYETSGTVIEVSTPDSPFLYDSVNEELQSWGLAVRHVIHPVIGIERGPDGRIDRIVHVREAPARESLMHFELDQDLTDQERTELEQAIRVVLGDVQLAVRDFNAMGDAARGMIEIARTGSALYPAEEVAETVAFLEWLLDLNFVFLGYREY